MTKRLPLARRISGRLGSVPSFLYGCWYLAMIPLFALIYARYPRGFQLSTVQTEPSTVAALSALAMDIQRGINLPLVLRGSPIQIDSVYLYLPMVVSNLQMGGLEDVGLFSMDLRLLVGDSAGPFGAYNLHALVLNGAIEQFYPSGDTSLVGDNYGVLFTAPHFPIPLTHILPVSTAELPGGNGIIWLFRSTTDRLAQISLLSNGVPDTWLARFPRMLYFSAVTITTLGFGEIVPVAPITRFLVAMEAVVGVIVVGLFLNSLAAERTT